MAAPTRHCLPGVAREDAPHLAGTVDLVEPIGQDSMLQTSIQDVMVVDRVVPGGAVALGIHWQPTHFLPSADVA